MKMHTDLMIAISVSVSQCGPCLVYLMGHVLLVSYISDPHSFSALHLFCSVPRSPKELTQWRPPGIFLSSLCIIFGCGSLHLLPSAAWGVSLMMTWQITDLLMSKRLECRNEDFMETPNCPPQSQWAVELLSLKIGPNFHFSESDLLS